MKRYIFIAFTLAVFLLGGSLIYGDDTADLYKVWAPPNMLWVLDTSSSMHTLPCNDESSGNTGCTSSFFDSLGYDPNTTYDTFDEDFSKFPDYFSTGYVYYQDGYYYQWEQAGTSIMGYCCGASCDSTSENDCKADLTEKGYHLESDGYHFTGNFLNFYPPRYMVARRVLKNLIISTLVRIRMGLMVYDGEVGGKLLSGVNPPCPTCLSDSPQWDSNRVSLINLINNKNTVDFGGSSNIHYTPLAETLFDAGSYFEEGVYDDTFQNDDGYSDRKVSIASDPIPYSCMANYVIIITDGIPTRDQEIPESIRNTDEDCNECRDPSGPGECYAFLKDDCSDYTPPCDRCYNNDGSDYLDDVAKWLAETDLRSNDACCEQDSDCDNTCGDQNLITYTVGFAVDHPLLQEAAVNGDGLYYTATNAQELEEALTQALQDIIRRTVSFTVPAVPSAQVRDVRETTGLTSEDKVYLASFLPTGKGPFEGHLRAYYLDCKGHIVGGNSCNPESCSDCELVVTNEAGVVTEVKCTGCELATDAAGNLTDENNQPIAQPIWDAGEVLKATPSANRNIYTVVDVDGDGVLEPEERIEFKTSIASGPLSLLRAALNLNDVNNDDFNGDGVITGADADLLIEFVRGRDIFDYDRDGNTNEERWKLGDIFHSSPVLVGQPNPLYYDFGFTCECKAPFCYAPQNIDDKGFRDSEKIMLRPKMLIVGANDGMIHCFNVGNADIIDNTLMNINNTCQREDLIDNVTYDNGDGSEMWAFIPPNLLPKLKDTISDHQYYVDGTPVVSDVYLGSESFGNKVKSNWRTVAICGEREGGKHYFALDVTYPLNDDPDDGNYDCPKFLWDFTDPKMGFAWSEALHGAEYGRVKLDRGGTEVEKWVAVVGGGYNPDYAVAVDGTTESYEGKAFFVVDIATGKKVWEYSYDPNATDDQQYMSYDIPSTPTPVDYNFIDLSFDGFIDWVYIGDLGGQMWKMSFNKGVDGNNELIPGDFDATDMKVTGWKGEKFFQADTSISDQPIYFRPSTLVGLAGNLWIYFGTGDRNNPKDLVDSQTRDISNRFYGIMDFGEDSSGNRIQSPALPFTESNLTDVTNPAITPVNDPGQSSRQGWYIRLDVQETYDLENHIGEKVLAKSSALAGNVYFTTYTPAQEVSDPCAPGITGTARLYAVHYQSGAAYFGGGRFVETGTGIPSPVIITAKVVEGRVEFSAMLSTSSGQVVQVPGVGGGKLLNIHSWREIFR